MGLRVQVGHTNSNCVSPQPGHKDFTVLHTNGLHHVAVDFCGCDQRKISNQQQLIRSEWFPATVHQPQTCTTFRLLELFHVVTLTGKLSAHEFYKSLEYMTDNTELDIPKVSRVSSLVFVEAYDHLFVPDSLQVPDVNNLRISPFEVNEATWLRERQGRADIDWLRRPRDDLSCMSYPWHQPPGQLARCWRGMEVCHCPKTFIIQALTLTIYIGSCTS